MLNDISVKAGNLLVAEPFLDDPHFGRAVILICDHDLKDGTVGFILNKNLNTSVGKIMQGMNGFEADVYYGGPVQHDTLHYLHNKGDLINGAIHVADNLYWGGDYEQIKFCIRHGLIEKQDIRFFVGYAGWSPDQLFDELEEVTWIVAEGDNNYVFNPDTSQLWQTVLAHKGGRYAVIAQMDTALTN